MQIKDASKVKVEQLAAVLGLSVQQIYNLRNDGVLSPAAKGRYDLAKSVQAYLEYVARGKTRAGNVDAKNRLMLAKAQMAELVAAERQGKLLNAEQVQQVINEAMVVVGTQMDGIGGRLAGELAGITDPAIIRQKLLNECRRIRSAAADKLAALGAIKPSGGDTAAATGPDAGPVGKSKSRASSRKRRTRTVS